MFAVPVEDAGFYLSSAKRWAGATPCVPHRKHRDLVCARNVVDVIASSFEQDPASTRYWGLAVQAPEVRRVADDVERGSQLVEEQVR